MAEYNIDNYLTNRDRALRELPTHLTALQLGPICAEQFEANNLLGGSSFTTSGTGDFLNRGAYIKPFTSYFQEDECCDINYHAIASGLTSGTNSFLNINMAPTPKDGSNPSRQLYEDKGFIVPTETNLGWSLFKFKCPQTIGFHTINTTNATNLQVTGYDAWGQLQQERLTITATAGSQYYQTRKTYKYLESVYTSGSISGTASINIGLGGKYGFQYRLFKPFDTIQKKIQLTELYLDFTIAGNENSPKTVIIPTPLRPYLSSTDSTAAAQGLVVTYIGDGDPTVTNTVAIPTQTGAPPTFTQVNVTFTRARAADGKYRLYIPENNRPLIDITDAQITPGDSNRDTRNRSLNQDDVRGSYNRGISITEQVDHLSLFRAMVFGYVPGADLYSEVNTKDGFAHISNIIGYKPWTESDDTV